MKIIDIEPKSKTIDDAETRIFSVFHDLLPKNWRIFINPYKSSWEFYEKKLHFFKKKHAIMIFMENKTLGFHGFTNEGIQFIKQMKKRFRVLLEE